MFSIVMHFFLLMAMTYMAVTARIVLPHFGMSGVWGWLFIAGWCFAVALLALAIQAHRVDRRCDTCGKVVWDPELLDEVNHLCFWCAERIAEENRLWDDEHWGDEEAEIHYANEEAAERLNASRTEEPFWRYPTTMVLTSRIERFPYGDN
jgi:hypothetical protein